MLCLQNRMVGILLYGLGVVEQAPEFLEVVVMVIRGLDIDELALKATAAQDWQHRAILTNLDDNC